ncbi:DUF397 domain-containing protein [Nocardia sp. NPDC057668]|uniref:DUF397 domain-containing protein n=1 Tax=Nocardia sp. NPDC057668 TaxID=3346202 RepID=UPI00367003F5
MNETGSTLPRRQLGRYLFEWRTRTGMTRTKAAQLLDMGAGVVGVRDSKNPAGAALVFDSGAWDRFTADVAKGSFNLP